MLNVDKFIDYESGDLDEEETVAFFQELVDSGVAWQLQGHYGRTARALIEAGELDWRDNHYKSWL